MIDALVIVSGTWPSFLAVIISAGAL